MKPIIGITCSWQEDKQLHAINDYYVQAVAAAGGIPLVIPCRTPDQAGDIYSWLDGLLLTGGPDLDPFYFGEEPRVGLGEITPLRDQLELELCRLALKGEKPLLAICRGLQVLNVAAGGSVHQDLAPVTRLMHSQKAPRWHPTHEVAILQDSGLYFLAGADRYRVNSFHHQGINELGQGLAAVAWSNDNLVEAVESPDKPLKIIGVQWHPETRWDRDRFAFRLFMNLVDQAGVR